MITARSGKGVKAPALKHRTCCYGCISKPSSPFRANGPWLQRPNLCSPHHQRLVCWLEGHTLAVCWRQLVAQTATEAVNHLPSFCARILNLALLPSVRSVLYDMVAACGGSKEVVAVAAFNDSVVFR